MKSVIEFFKESPVATVFGIGGIILIGLAISLAWQDSQDTKARNAFIAECVSSGEPHYKCVALWRSGEHPSPVIVTPPPVVVR